MPHICFRGCGESMEVKMKQEIIQKAGGTPKRQGPNLTGIPTQIKLDFERSSGLSFADVRVHYNSDRPAKIGALAYTQGAQVYVAPRQERHLKHELGHVVQQMRGAVRPTGWINGLPVNTDPDLEYDADQCHTAPMREAPNIRFPYAGYRAGLSSAAVPATIQPKVSIDGVAEGIEFGPYSGVATEIFDAFVLPYLQSNHLRTWGIRTVYRRFINESGGHYTSIDHFMEELMAYLAASTRRSRNGSTSVLKPFSVTSMSRPPFPKELKDRLYAGIPEGQRRGMNIRHVIRNNTFIQAMQTYVAQNSLESLVDLAERLGLGGSTYDASIRQLYRRLYLNISNLWAGDGFENQMIGMLSSPLEEYGLHLINGTAEYNEEDLYILMKKATAIVRGAAQQKQELLDNFWLQIITYVCNNGLDDCSAGLFIIEIAKNLGMDLPQSEEPDPRRQGMLIELEIRFEQYISSGGMSEPFEELFLDFCQISDFVSGSSSDAPQPAEEPDELTEDNSDTEILDEIEEQVEYAQINSYLRNNCLIEAIYDAAQIPPDDAQILAIRNMLASEGLTPVGEMLDAGDPETMGIILSLIFPNPWNYYVTIYSPSATLISEFNRAALPGQTELRLYYTGDHFVAMH